MSETDVRPKKTRTHTFDGAPDPYDHAITLIDTTVPQETETEPRTRSPSPGSRQLTKKPTKGSVREQLARRKYAKWQQGRYPSEAGNIGADDEGHVVTPTASTSSTPLPPQESRAGEASETEVADFGAHQTESSDARKGKKAQELKRHSEQPCEVDILYENQRGWFFFGIPLYSHSSLLNFDPSPWMTKDLKDSAVNITNAQVPDPSWAWAWKSWYVDMSYDVDEEGWQYSFSFARRFAWHGTHPWFHSFVRRRRWLRKRVKRQDNTSLDKEGGLSDAHKLTGDYFTIHPKRDRSPASVDDGAVKTARPSSYISIRTATDIDEQPDDIRDIPSLLKAMRLAKIDREKFDAVRKFVDQGGDELAYLGEKMPEIMSFFVFQNSRRHLLRYLQASAADAQKHRDEHDAEERADGDTDSRRTKSLLAAVEAADGDLKGLEYWSDRKHALKTTDESNGGFTGHKRRISGASTARSALEDNPVDVIKGISQDAEIQGDPSTSRLLGPPPEERRTGNGDTAKDKGKGKAADKGDQKEAEVVEESTEDRLAPDSVFIPD